MRDLKLSFAQFSMLLADMCIGGFAYIMFCWQDGCGAPAFGLWAAGIAAAFAVNILMRRRRAAVNAAVAVNAIMCAGLAALLLWRLAEAGAPEFARCAVFAALAVFTVLHSYVLAGQGWKYNQQILYMDGMAACTAFLIMVDSAGTFGNLSSYISWTLIALIFSVLSITMQRMRSLKGSGIWLLAAAAALAAGILAAGPRLTAGAKAAADAALWCLGRLWAGLRAVLSLLGRLILWLLSFIKTPEGDVMLPDQIQSVHTPAYELEELAGPDHVIFAVIGALLLGFIAWRVFRLLRGKKLSAMPAFLAGTEGSELGGEKGMLARIFGALLERLRFSFAYLARRNSAEGLLTYAERSFRRLPGESAHSFLRRIGASASPAGSASADPAGSASSEPTLAQSFETLASALESAYYGGFSPALPAGFARTFRRAARAAARSFAAASHERP